MASIDTSREALLALITRVEREHGATALANFALDEQLTRAETHIQNLVASLAAKDEQIVAMSERMRRLQEDNEELKRQLDPTRAERKEKLQARRRA